MKKYLLIILALCLVLVGCQKKEELLKTSTELYSNSKEVLEIYGHDDIVTKVVITETYSDLDEEEIANFQQKLETEKESIKDKKYVKLDQKIEENIVTDIITMDMSKKEYISGLAELKALPEFVKTNDNLTLTEAIKIYESYGYKFD